MDYKNIGFFRAATEFTEPAKLGGARRTFKVFLTVVLFIEFAGITVQGANLASTVQVAVQRPHIVEAGFWLLYVYSFVVYASLYFKELRLALVTGNDEKSFFQALNRSVLDQKLKEVTGRPSSGLGQSELVTQNRDVTDVRYDMPMFDEKTLAEISPRIPGLSGDRFVYRHTNEDRQFFERSRSVVRPGLAHNYLVYVFPMHVGILLLLWKAWTLVPYVSASLASLS